MISSSGADVVWGFSLRDVGDLGGGGPTNDFDQNVALRAAQRYRTLPGLNDP